MVILQFATLNNQRVDPHESHYKTTSKTYSARDFPCSTLPPIPRPAHLSSGENHPKHDKHPAFFSEIHFNGADH
jgi:hypothetical protein